MNVARADELLKVAKAIVNVHGQAVADKMSKRLEEWGKHDRNDNEEYWRGLDQGRKDGMNAACVSFEDLDMWKILAAFKELEGETNEVQDQ